MCIEKLKWSLTSQCKGSGNGYGDKCGRGSEVADRNWYVWEVHREK